MSSVPCNRSCKARNTFVRCRAIGRLMGKHYRTPQQVQFQMEQIGAAALELPLHRRQSMRTEIVQRKPVVLSPGENFDGAYQRKGLASEFAVAEPTTPRPQREARRRRGGGRPRSLTPEQIGQGIAILRNQPMTLDAACATLRDAGINGSRSAVYRFIFIQAYPERS